MGNRCFWNKKKVEAPPDPVADSGADNPTTSACDSGVSTALRKSSHNLGSLLRKSMSFVSPQAAPTDILSKISQYKPLLANHVTQLVENSVFAQTVDDEAVRNLGVLLAWPLDYASAGLRSDGGKASSNNSSTAPRSAKDVQRTIDFLVQAIEVDFKSKHSKIQIARVAKSGPYARSTCVGYCELHLVVFVTDLQPPFDSSVLTAFKKTLWRVESKRLVIKSVKSSTSSPSTDGAMCVSAVVNECLEVSIFPAPNYGSGHLQLKHTLDKIEVSARPQVYLPALCEQHCLFTTSNWADLHVNGQALIRICKLWTLCYDIRLLSPWAVECLAIYISLALRHTQTLTSQLKYFFQTLHSFARAKLSGGFASADCHISYPGTVFWKDRKEVVSPATTGSAVTCGDNRPTLQAECLRDTTSEIGCRKLKLYDPVSKSIDLIELVPREEWARIEKLASASCHVMQKPDQHTLVELFALKPS